MLRKILVVLVTLMAYCHAAFHFSDLRLYFPSIGNMATSQTNNSLIMFGGINATTRYASELYELTFINNAFTFHTLPQINRPNGTSDGRVVIVNNQSNMYLLGGFTNTTYGQNLPLQMSMFTFATSNWTTFRPIFPTPAPLNRVLHSSVYDGNRSVYILGGQLNPSMIFSDFYVMDTITGVFTVLPSLPIEIFSHTMTYLSNGQIIIIGGAGRSSSMPDIQTLSMDFVYIFNTTDRLWYNHTVAVLPGENLPSSRLNHNAVVSSDNKIYIFGGDNGLLVPNKAVLDVVNVLDTTTWTWSSPLIYGAPPARRSFASTGFFDSKYLVTAFGQGLDGYYGDINVYDTSTNTWLMSFTPAEAESSLSGGVIAGVTIVCFIAFICLILLIWKFKRYIQLLFKKVHQDIWKPRTGEPLWAETTRFLFQIFLLFIFALFLAFVIRQAIKSPDVVQIIQEPAASVEVPDIRFCYDGIAPPAPGVSGVTCATDMGYNCNSFMIPLNMSLFTPVFTDMAGDVNCYLFRAPEDFILTATSGKNNGSKLFFNYYGTPQSTAGRVHVAFYPKKMDPNVVTYGIVDSIPNLLNEEIIANWVTKELNDQEASGIYDVQPYTYSVANYDMIDRQYLQSVGWNYVGFLPVTNSTPQIQTHFREEMPNPAYAETHSDLGKIQVLPDSFSTIIQRDVKIYTLVNALGFVGGIFGLLIAIQTWLFGYRPRSPWGVVHRWSTGERKRSLLRGLQSKFKITNSGIPLVHPVHHRYSMTNLGNLDLNEPDDQRINRVEDRMQMLEMLFKAYYIDDEVFRSLDDADKVENKSWLSRQKRSGDTVFNETRDFASMVPIQDEKIITEDTLSNRNINNNITLNDKDKSLPLVFSRHDTEESTSSHTHLTAHQERSVSQYKPNTTFQMNEF